MKSWGEDEEIFFSLIMSHQENNACLPGRNVSSPGWRGNNSWKKRNNLPSRGNFLNPFSKTSARLRQLCSQRGIPQFVKPTQP